MSKVKLYLPDDPEEYGDIYDDDDIYSVDTEFDFAADSEILLINNDVNSLDGAKLTRILDSGTFEIKSPTGKTIGKMYVYVDS